MARLGGLLVMALGIVVSCRPAASEGGPSAKEPVVAAQPSAAAATPPTAVSDDPGAVCAAVPAAEADARARCASLVAHPWFAPPRMLPHRECRPAIDPAWLACAADADCAGVALSACDHCNGGAYAAVGRRFVASAGRLASACDHPPPACTELACVTPSPVACRRGQCAVVERPTGVYCSAEAPCAAGEQCAERRLCGGGRQCLPVGHRFADDANGCGIAAVNE